MAKIFWWWWFSNYVYLSINNWYIGVKERQGHWLYSESEIKGVYTSKLKPLYTAFLHGIKLSGYRMGIKFEKDPLAVEQNNYATKIVSAYIVYG